MLVAYLIVWLLTSIAVLFFFGVLSFLWTKIRAPGFHVADKHVFITGGSSGLGLSIAKKYAIAGAKISIIARNMDKLMKAKLEIEAVQKDKKHPVFTAACDVTDFQAVERTVKEANEFHKQVTDHVICNAGVARPGYFLEQDVSVYREMMDLNYFGTVHTVKAALPEIIENKVPASIVMVASACSLVSFVGYSQYCPSKYAVRGFAEALRNELLPYKVKVHIFYPGSIDTSGFEEENRFKPKETQVIEGSSAVTHPDKVAQSLINGMKNGKFAIVNEVILSVLRVLSNGVAPRNNSPFELLFYPLCFAIQIGYTLFMDYAVLKIHKRKMKKQ